MFIKKEKLKTKKKKKKKKNYPMWESINTTSLISQHVLSILFELQMARMEQIYFHHEENRAGEEGKISTEHLD